MYTIIRLERVHYVLLCDWNKANIVRFTSICPTKDITRRERWTRRCEITSRTPNRFDFVEKLTDFFYFYTFSKEHRIKWPMNKNPNRSKSVKVKKQHEQSFLLLFPYPLTLSRIVIVIAMLSKTGKLFRPRVMMAIYVLAIVSCFQAFPSTTSDEFLRKRKNAIRWHRRRSQC